MNDNSMIEKPLKTVEINIINTELFYNKIKFDFSINKINEDKLRFILLNKNSNIFIEKYHAIYNLEQLKSINKYFKMFEKLNELQDDLLEIIKDNNIEIINVSKDEIIITLKVSLKNDNIIKLKLQKISIDDRDKINFLLEEFKELKQSSEIKEKIAELENNISIISKELNEKNKKIEFLENNLIKQNSEIKDKKKKIEELENKISTISNELDNKNKRIDSLEINLNEFKNIFNLFKEEINKKIDIASSKFGNALKSSKIFETNDEIELLLSNIPFKAKNLKLLYDSKIEGENEEKLLNTYTGKNDLIVLIKTNKSKRFGGYAHECFEKKNFEKNDMKAFLFNLDKKEIYKSNNKNSTFSIWRGFNNNNSINFGTGTDLKIFHKFFSKECATYQTSNDYDYKNEKFALNGEEYFNISYLEIYKVC